MSKPICTVMVGLPASGKSTRVNNMTRMDSGAFVYSTDNILERIAEQLGKTYNEVFEKHIKSAQQEADIWLAEAIKNKQDIIWDQTNLGFKKRRKIISNVKKHGYNVVCECFVPPEGDSMQILLQRLKNRTEKQISLKVIENMQDSYIKPEISEGFSRITFYDIHGNIISVNE